MHILNIKTTILAIVSRNIFVPIKEIFNQTWFITFSYVTTKDSIVLCTNNSLFCIPRRTMRVHFLCSASPSASFHIIPLESVIKPTESKVRLWPQGNPRSNASHSRDAAFQGNSVDGEKEACKLHDILCILIKSELNICTVIRERKTEKYKGFRINNGVTETSIKRPILSVSFSTPQSLTLLETSGDRN